MVQYFNEFIYLTQQLASVKKPVEDECIDAIALQGLPEEYEPMLTVIENFGSITSSLEVKRWKKPSYHWLL